MYWIEVLLPQGIVIALLAWLLAMASSAASSSLSCKNFGIISVNSEDIYLKLRLVVNNQKGNPYK